MPELFGLLGQANKVWHVSNLYRIPEGEKLADRLCEATFADTVFFAELRRRGDRVRDQDGAQISVGRRPAGALPDHHFEGAFHGRTLATIAAAGNKKYLEGFGPRSKASTRCRSTTSTR